MKRLTIITTTLNSSKFLSRYFEGILALNHLKQIQVIMVMNLVDSIERQIAHEYCVRNSNLFRIIILDHRETIGASLNRGMALAETQYMSFLDVDDIRVSDSFDRQIATLDNNPDVDYTYGDFVVVDSQGKTQGGYAATKEFDEVNSPTEYFTGPTHLFRSTLVKKMGGFDEQLKSAADYEFVIRARLSCKFKKTPGVLYYYTSFANSGSASSTVLSPIEGTVVSMRYGYYSKVDYRYLKAVRNYRIDHLLLNGEWVPVKQLVPNYDKLLAQEESARLRLKRRYPYWITFYRLSYPARLIWRNARPMVRELLNSFGLRKNAAALRNWFQFR
jgi:glycosyltransferase involved in cell wall biosynthesis